jgi:subtilisin family serine protease
VLVAVSDTGLDVNHEDLAANVWTNPGEIPGNGVDDDDNGYIDDVHGWDWVNNDADPADDLGQGTHCAGTIGGVGDNGVGVAGVNWKSFPLATLVADLPPPFPAGESELAVVSGLEPGTTFLVRAPSRRRQHDSSRSVATSAPGQAGVEESVRIAGLVPGRWCMAVRATDEAGNEGPLSDVISVEVP